MNISACIKKNKIFISFYIDIFYFTVVFTSQVKNSGPEDQALASPYRGGFAVGKPME